jgi:hypothetical protein
MAQFNSPYVVQLVGVVTVGKPLYVILEFMEHGDLKGYLEKNYIDEETKLLFAGDCAEGLHHIHSKGAALLPPFLFFVCSLRSHKSLEYSAQGFSTETLLRATCYSAARAAARFPTLGEFGGEPTIARIAYKFHFPPSKSCSRDGRRHVLPLQGWQPPGAVVCTRGTRGAQVQRGDRGVELWRAHVRDLDQGRASVQGGLAIDWPLATLACVEASCHSLTHRLWLLPGLAQPEGVGAGVQRIPPAPARGLRKGRLLDRHVFICKNTRCSTFNSCRRCTM